MRADGEGLQPDGTRLRIDFGRAEAGAVAATARLIGSQPSGREQPQGCGGRVLVRWANGFAMTFAAGAFTGWTSGSGRGTPVATVTGLAPGQSAAALAGASFEDTPRGREFRAGDVRGRLDGEEIAVLWSGQPCFVP